MEDRPMNPGSGDVLRALAISSAGDLLLRPTPSGAKVAAMDLVLWRHAEAEPRAEEGDLARPLTRKGHRQAARVAAWLDCHLPDGTRILSSPARRALETAHALGRNVKARDELGPQSRYEDALEVLNWHAPGGPRLKGSLLVVGHRTMLAPLAARLLGIAEADLVFRKGAVWWLRARLVEGCVQASLVASLSPELVTGA